MASTAAAVALASTFATICLGAAAGEPWTRTAGSISVSVDTASFAYSTQLIGAEGGCGAFSGGGVAFRCDGVHYTHGTPQPGDAALKLSSPPQEHSGADSLGAFDSIGADWQGGSSAACALHTEIRHYSATASFVFVADFSEDGVPRTNSTALLSPEPKRGGPADLPGLATAFPTWAAGGSMGSECEYYSYEGNSLGDNWRAGALSTWTGGLQAGPLLLYPANSSAVHPPSMLLSPLTHAKAMIGSPGDKAAGKKSVVFAPFYAAIDYFAKTGSRQT